MLQYSVVQLNHMTHKTTLQQKSILSLAHHDYNKKLNSYAFFKVSSHSIGEELVQETFLKTWKYILKGGKIEVMRSFLYHILNNLIIDQYRKNKTSSLDYLVDNGFEPIANETKNLFDILDGKKAILMIKNLPLKYQKVMRMKYVQDLSIKEMSLLTGQSKNNITVQAYRGLQKLKLLYHHL